MLCVVGFKTWLVYRQEDRNMNHFNKITFHYLTLQFLLGATEGNHINKQYKINYTLIHNLDQAQTLSFRFSFSYTASI